MNRTQQHKKAILEVLDQSLVALIDTTLKGVFYRITE